MKKLGFWVAIFIISFGSNVSASTDSCRRAILSFAEVFPDIDPDKPKLLSWAKYVDEAPPEVALASAFNVLGLGSKQVQSPSTFTLVLDILSQKKLPLSPKVAANLARFLILSIPGDRKEYDNRLNEFIGSLIVDSPGFVGAIANSLSDEEFGKIRINLLDRLIDATAWALESYGLASSKRAEIVSELYKLRRDLLTVYYIRVRAETVQVSAQLKALKEDLSTRAFVGSGASEDAASSPAGIAQLRQEISDLKSAAMIYAPEDNKRIEELSSQITELGIKMKAIRRLQAKGTFYIDEYDGDGEKEFSATSFAERGIPNSEGFFEDLDEIQYQIFLMLEFADSVSRLSEDSRFLAKPGEFAAKVKVPAHVSLEKFRVLWAKVGELWYSVDTADQHMSLISLVKRMEGARDRLFKIVAEFGMVMESRHFELSAEFKTLADEFERLGDIYIQTESRFFENSFSDEKNYGILDYLETAGFDLFETPESLWESALDDLGTVSLEPSVALPSSRLVRNHIASLVDSFKISPEENEKREILKFVYFMQSRHFAVMKSLGASSLDPLTEFILTKRAVRIIQLREFLISELLKLKDSGGAGLARDITEIQFPIGAFMIFLSSTSLDDFAQRKAWVKEWESEGVEFSNFSRELLEAWGSEAEARNLPIVLPTE